MPSTSTTLRMRITLLTVAVSSVTALCLSSAGLPLLPSLASPGAPDSPNAQFRPVDRDGSLPTRAPQLRSADAPLSTAEGGYAIRLAQQSMPTGARDVLGNPGGEVLAAALPPTADRGTGRRAMVSIYDYETERLHQVLVDLATGSVLRSQEMRGLQLPPSIAETTIATQLAVAAKPAPAFLEEYRRATGAPLVAAEQVQAVGGIWRSADDTAAPVGPTRVCGRDRCLQLLLALPSGQYLGTEDFAVDLSSRTVLPVGPGELEHHHD